MTTMSTSRPSTTPMMAPVITPAWIGTVVRGEEKEEKRKASEGGTGENDAANLKYKGGSQRDAGGEFHRDSSRGASKDVVIGWRKWTGEESEEAKLEGRRTRDERVEKESKGKIKVEWKIGNEGAVVAEMEIR